MSYTTREYECDGMCQVSKPPVQEIFNLKCINMQLTEQAYRDAYATPGERAMLNDAMDRSHTVAHWLAERQTATRMNVLEDTRVEDKFAELLSKFESCFNGTCDHIGGGDVEMPPPFGY